MAACLQRLQGFECVDNSLVHCVWLNLGLATRYREVLIIDNKKFFISLAIKHLGTYTLM